MNRWAKQQAAALITALFIVALGAIIATAIAVNQRLLIHQTQLLNDYDQMVLYLQGVQYWAIDEIKQSTSNGINSGVLKNNRFLPLTLGNVTVDGSVVDATAYFNLNSLAFTQNQPHFNLLVNLLKAKPNVDLAQNISNWLGSAIVDDNAYLQLTPPYRPSHHLMAEPSELRTVLGVDQSLYLALQPYIVALPQINYATNINTAPKIMLMALSPMITENLANAILSCRNTAGQIINWNQLVGCVPQLAHLDSQTESGISYSTRYFIVYAHAHEGDRQLNLISLLYLVPTQMNGPPRVDILWQAIE